MDQINIVCLHGFTQNSLILEKKLKKLFKPLKNVKCYYLQGPVLLHETGAELARDTPQELNTEQSDHPSAYWVYDLCKPLEVDWSHHHKDGNVTYFLEDSLKASNNLEEIRDVIEKVNGFNPYYISGGTLYAFFYWLTENGLNFTQVSEYDRRSYSVNVADLRMNLL